MRDVPVDWRERISVDPEVCHGKACIRGTRVMVSVVLDNLGAGDSPEAIARDYHIEIDDVRAALIYAGELAREQVVALPRLDAVHGRKRGRVIEFVRGDLAAVGRTTMSHPDHELKVALYPVFHIGSPSFYAALSEDLGRFRVFLLEGVRWRGWRGPLYDRAARNLGLVTQRERLCFPPDAECLPLDMTEAEFTREARALPLHWRAVLWFLRPILWAVTATEAGRHRVWASFSKENYVRGLRDVDGPLEELIKTKRDRAMSWRLREFVQDPVRIGQAVPVAVVAGAGHMPVLYRTLRDSVSRRATSAGSRCSTA